MPPRGVVVRGASVPRWVGMTSQPMGRRRARSPGLDRTVVLASLRLSAARTRSGPATSRIRTPVALKNGIRGGPAFLARPGHPPPLANLADHRSRPFSMPLAEPRHRG